MHWRVRGQSAEGRGPGTELRTVPDLRWWSSVLLLGEKKSACGGSKGKGHPLEAAFFLSYSLLLEYQVR